MKKIFLLAIFFVSIASHAQDFKISGKILEKDTNIPLESATVYVEKVKDSSLINYTISDRDGNFELQGSAAEKIRLLISYTGYKPFSRIVEPSSATINVGSILLAPQSNELGEVMINANRAPVTIKNDTLEFNAASFNTRQDANLEDVMKKLPGVEVDSQGNITVNGKPVSRILVNGKEFFGNDPKIATKNLPKEIIDKIQVVDTKTKSEEFTGKAGDPENKTINITIQEDKNKGYFARATAGSGTDERYELSGIGNYFKDELRVSVLASSNNINSSGFSFDEVFDMMGRGNVRSMRINGNGSFGINGNNFGSDQGITKAETAGVNLVNEWEGNKEASGNYFFGRNHTKTWSVTERENILPDSRYFSFSENSGDLINDSHRASASFEYEPDTLTRIAFEPRFNRNSGFSERESQRSSTTENGNLINSTEIFDNEDFSSSTFGSRLNFIRKFGGEGSYLQLNFSNNHEIRKSENNYFSQTLLFEAGEEETIFQDQLIDEDQKENRYEVGVTKRSVLAENFFLDISYDFEIEDATNKRYVFETDENTGSPVYNVVLSNEFELKSNKHIPNAGINYEGQKWRFGTEVGAILTSLNTQNKLTQTDFEADYQNLFVSANVRYNVNRSANLYARYSTSTNIPSINQLQPVPIVTNPLNVIYGNPGLDPSFSHSFYGGFRKFDMATRSGFHSYMNFTLTNDNVVPFTTVGENLVRETTYVNVDGVVNSYAGLFYNKTYKKETREFKYRLGLSGNYNRGVGFINTVKYQSDRVSVRPGITLGYEIEELLSINPGYELNFNHSTYDIDDRRKENFTNHTFTLETTTYWPKNVVFGNDISYTYLGNINPGFKNTSLLWNASLGYKFWKDNATLKVKVYDLLNDNISTQRIVGDDFIEDTNRLILEQYFMLSFTYKISKFGGKDPNEGGGMRMF